ncbi:hypothetical protein FT663_03524 [Candidozyma haemuli var. vulneris]|uniref:Glutamate--tRNA ligase, mitochondrial n=1 Tax=Candidozyma haemuli TaxID=45357 RepID=A0A2V1AUA7_9ASCO|nr:glutamate-tRNA ligase [[Candida] haemuloni]KAF3988210.1 hypothetical protein FT662_03556 [[Candida] haemuloni var. vulneris]KAF3989668.1 hypothetical protein FT663_03524 [[Candida] haemuloni var. vulneris]PVH21399.1 glutamate-tRNA ligase [[Candida] haemuloni]
MRGALRLLSKLSLKGKLQAPSTRASVQPQSPARTRFAPSPTGFLHLGSLRTALYNYLLAKSTGGQFLLRLEDTDQKRLVQGAEANIYESLNWTGLVPDESPENGGPYGPYRQSERMSIYKKYADQLIESGYAYRCFCPKDRLVHLRESAMAMKPPTTVTYDRKCLHSPEPNEVEYTVRFRSPDRYEPFTDLLHGKLDLQPQINQSDKRYDDFVILKSDGLPTYHFANVVDDHLMKITHVIRGEEWLASTPKHVAMYRAFGWEPPQFIHIPLLTSLSDKKLSKRQGDIGILSMRDEGILPEALTNFAALFGWAPPRPVKGKTTSEVMALDELVSKFSLDHLTKGNAKVNDNKLHFFNKSHLSFRINDPERLDRLVEETFPAFEASTAGRFSKDFYKRLVHDVGPSMNSIKELRDVHTYFFEEVDLAKATLPAEKVLVSNILKTLQAEQTPETPFPVEAVLSKFPDLKKKNIFEATRYALAGGVSGITIPSLIDLLGYDTYLGRIQKAITFLE